MPMMKMRKLSGRDRMMLACLGLMFIMTMGLVLSYERLPADSARIYVGEGEHISRSGDHSTLQEANPPRIDSLSASSDLPSKPERYNPPANSFELLTDEMRIFVLPNRRGEADVGNLREAVSDITGKLHARVDIFCEVDVSGGWTNGEIFRRKPSPKEVDGLLVVPNPGLQFAPRSLEFAVRALRLVEERNNVMGICFEAFDFADRDPQSVLLLSSSVCRSAFLLTRRAQSMIQADMDFRKFFEKVVDRNFFLAFPVHDLAGSGVSKLDTLYEMPRMESLTIVPIERIENTDFEMSNSDALGQLEMKIRSLRLGWILLSTVDKDHVPLAKNFLCTLSELGLSRNNIVWATMDDEATEAMRTLDGSIVFRLKGMHVDSGVTVFGSPGYWDLKLSRAKLVHSLLHRGISVLLFDVDQVWLKDPISTIMERARNPHVDVVGTARQNDEVGVNLFYLRPTGRTLKMYNQLVEVFDKEFYSWQMHTKSDRYSRRIADDMSLLASFLYSNSNWKKEYPSRFERLDPDLFIDGRWYKGVFHEQKRSLFPIVVSNNLAFNNERRVQVAKKFGHWFLDDANEQCRRPKVIKGLQ